MKQVIAILSIIIICSIADNFSDNPQVNKIPACPECGESDCIYQDIESKSKDKTDADYYKAIMQVQKERGLTEKQTAILLNEYYL